MRAIEYTTGEIWLIILLLGVGTYLIRFSFLGLIGDRELPEWLLRHLRYTPVAFIPGLVAPLILWPSATGGEPDAARLIAAFITVVSAYWSKNMLVGIFAGAASFAVLLNVL